jgi:hypothetical protein
MDNNQNENKYTKMLNYSEKLNKKYNYFMDLSCDKTLYEIMHSQTKYNLNTYDDVKFSLFLYIINIIYIININ